jgi:hypothetical protein
MSFPSPGLPTGSRAIPLLFAGLGLLSAAPARAYENVFLTGVPDYQWHMGCFGTASGNLIGYWDRHGLPNYYTGPTAGGVAPLNSFGINNSIRALWASEAGVDGRPLTQPGHADDYYRDYESTGQDPHVVAGRPAHAPDCIGDYLGLNQLRWADLGGECRGNIDGYSFNFFDRDGHRRTNHVPLDASGTPIPDLQSGLRTWSASRGYPADSFSQLADFNPDKPAGRGFTFEDLKSEIDSGYPVLLFMQPFGFFSRIVEGQSGLNPEIHGMLAYGYLIDDNGTPYVRYRTSWGSGDREFSPWTPEDWTPEQSLNLPLRGVIGFHPKPRITRIVPREGGVRVEWSGPLAVLRNDLTAVETPVHRYVVERANALTSSAWTPVTEPAAVLSAELNDCCGDHAFLRIRLLEGP